METGTEPVIVVSHASALRGLRSARRRYGALPWRALESSEQRRILAARQPLSGDVDMSPLIREGFTDGELPVEALTGAPGLRRHDRRLHPHVLSGTLPPGSILEVSRTLYTVGPTIAALQFAASHGTVEAAALLLELAGGFSLPESHRACPEGALPVAAGEPDGVPSHYGSDPVLSMHAVERFCTGTGPIKGKNRLTRVLPLALDGARSPVEAIMAALFHAPQRYGGFGIADMALNKVIPFSPDAATVSGMSYAVCDAYIASARSCLEYNGHHHDSRGRRIRDERRAMGLSAMGIKVFIINEAQLRDIEALEVIAKMIAARAGRRYQTRVEGYRVKQVSLLNGLRRAFGLRPC